MRAVCLALLLSACADPVEDLGARALAASSTKEDFESGSKGAYAPADVVLASGSWHFADALVGFLATDDKHGSRSARVRGSGSLTMLGDLDGVGTVSVSHGTFGSDEPSSWQLFYSEDGGASWIAAGEPVTSTPDLSEVSFVIERSGPIRLQLRKLGGSSRRINFDDLVVSPPGEPVPEPVVDAGVPDAEPPPTGEEISPHTALGLPSPGEYWGWSDIVLVKAPYVHSYNGNHLTPNWASWELNASYFGTASKQDQLLRDPSLWFTPQPSAYDYEDTVWLAGQLCPSGDRTKSKAANASTFYLTNVLPQAANLDDGPWARLEEYARALAGEGRQLYVIAGGLHALAPPQTNGHGIAVPTDLWKVMVVADGTGPGAVNTDTRVIAVVMPNRDDAVSLEDDWRPFRVSVDYIENATGYDLLRDVDPAVQAIIEARVDDL